LPFAALAAAPAAAAFFTPALSLLSFRPLSFFAFSFRGFRPLSYFRLFSFFFQYADIEIILIRVYLLMLFAIFDAFIHYFDD